MMIRSFAVRPWLWRHEAKVVYARTYSSAASERISLAYNLYKPPARSRTRENPSPVVFMHGLFGCKKNNRSMSKMLASDLGIPVYAVDLRNHGDSPHHAKHDYTELALDVEAFIKEQDLLNPILVGHSMGAKTAMTLALRSPELVSSVIAIDNAPIHLPLKEYFYRYAKGMKAVTSAKPRTLAEADTILQHYEQDPSIRLFLMTNLAHDRESGCFVFRVPVDTLASSFDALGDFPMRHSKDARFSKPVLVVRGTQAHYIPDDSLPVIKSFFPQSKVVDLDCGHWVITEKPQEFRHAAVDFLRPAISIIAIVYLDRSFVKHLHMHFNAIVAVVGALVSSTTAYPSLPGYGHGNGNGRPSNTLGNIQLGPRPGYLVDMMDDSKLKSKLQSCSTKRSRTTDFSISHRGAPLQLPEHTKESWLAAARTGAGLVECDLAFTQDRQLVCRHSQCDLHTTTNILAIPELAAKCTKPFTPATDGKSASAKCCTSDITLDEFKSLCGKMDGADDTATTVEEYMDGTAEWRTDLYASSCGTLMSHKEFIRLVDSLGLRFTSELKAPEVKMPFQGNYTQELYAQQLIDEYKEARISPSRVWPQSFNVEDIYYWIKHEPEFGKHAVYLDDRVDTPAGYEQAVASMGQLRRRGVRIISPPVFALLTLDSNKNGKIVPSEYARAARRVGLDIIAWSLERSGPLTEVADNGDYFYTSIAAAIKDDGDMYEVIDVLARKVGVLGLFSDWPATVTYYANCFGL